MWKNESINHCGLPMLCMTHWGQPQLMLGKAVWISRSTRPRNGKRLGKHLLAAVAQRQRPETRKARHLARVKHDSDLGDKNQPGLVAALWNRISAHNRVLCLVRKENAAAAAQGQACVLHAVGARRRTRGANHKFNELCKRDGARWDQRRSACGWHKTGRQWGRTHRSSGRLACWFPMPCDQLRSCPDVPHGVPAGVGHRVSQRD